MYPVLAHNLPQPRNASTNELAANSERRSGSQFRSISRGIYDCVWSSFRACAQQNTVAKKQTSVTLNHAAFKAAAPTCCLCRRRSCRKTPRDLVCSPSVVALDLHICRGVQNNLPAAPCAKQMLLRICSQSKSCFDGRGFFLSRFGAFLGEGARKYHTQNLVAPWLI
jgi:hypothetical protein